MTGPKALLLAAGLGTRLRPLTDVLPKCLVPICGRPLLGYWLEMLDRAGIQRIVVNLHHHADLVRRYVEQSPYAAKVTLAHEEKLLGTGGTLLANRRLLEGGPVLVAHADNLSVFDPLDLLRHHARRPEGCVMTMMTFKSDDPRSCGVVETDHREVMAGFHEKVADPPGKIANAAVYVFEDSIFGELAAMEKKTVNLSTEILPTMVDRALCYRNHEFHRDVGTLSSLLAAQFELPLLCPDYVKRSGPNDQSWVALLQSGEPTLASKILHSLKASFRNP